MGGGRGSLRFAFNWYCIESCEGKPTAVDFRRKLLNYDSASSIRCLLRHLPQTPSCDFGPGEIIKRVIGETVAVEADVFADGHDQVVCQILYSDDSENFQSSPMKPLANDRWRGEFTVLKMGQYQYTVEGWIDHFQTWRHALEKRIAADQDVQVELLIGVELVEAAAMRVTQPFQCV